jgi:hypothetical protein
MLPYLPEVDFIERIGKGSFGEVYKGKTDAFLCLLHKVQGSFFGSHV